MKPAWTRALTLALVALFLCSMAVPLAAADTSAGPSIDHAHSSVFAQENNETATNESDAGNDTETDTDSDEFEDSNVSDGEPGLADRVRVSPVSLGDEDWLETTTEDSDEAFNTTGPFALFTLSEPAENVRIAQSDAEATLLEGDTTILVEYEPGAAGSSSTFFELEVFFPDSSTSSIDLYATSTEVSAAAAELEAYGGLIDDMQDSAEEEGYDTDPSGLEDYYDWRVERATLVDSFLVERAAQLLILAIMAAENPLVWILILLSIAVAAYRREQAHGWILDRIENDSGETARQQEQLEAEYRRDKQTANEEFIGELPQINDQQAVYWNDSFDIHSTLQLAELALRGPRDLEISSDAQPDGGQPESAIAELEAETIHNSWLAEVYTTNRLSGPREALSCLKAALIRMEATYSMGHRYSGVRNDVEQLLDEIDELERGF
ncbi:hypothetical protein [Natronosalvus amylolyticus]|uniref:hypothetical protein n=1 Tax=Natronosalvus amylolyticus TaxID=2961994 RepID=UPI0020CA0143|nr:hypothetical protein [Natronosalvus amylolyticus]